jgi:hypothetical protein
MKEAGLQIPVPTNRKYIRGSIERVSKHTIVKPATNNFNAVDVTVIGRKKKLLPGEVSKCLEHSGEVSRYHISWWYRATKRNRGSLTSQ